MKRILCLMLGLMLLMTCAVGCNKETPITEVDGSAVVMKSEHYEITLGEFQYFLEFVYSNFLAENPYVAGNVFDDTQPLRSQSCPMREDEGMSWFDYFSEGAVDQVTMYMTLAEDAIEKGLELSEERKREINDDLVELDALAQENGYGTTDAYLQDRYGKYVTRETIKECYQLFYYSEEARMKLMDGFQYTDEQYKAYAAENPSGSYVADFLYMSVFVDAEEDADEEAMTAALATAEKQAVEINNAITDEASFLAQTEQYLRSYFTVVPDEEEETIEDDKTITETTLQNYLSGSRIEGVSYTVDIEGGAWVFDPNRVAGEHAVVVDETNGYVEIYYMLKPMYLNEDPTVSVRHILIDEETAGSMEAAEKQASDLLVEWKAGAASEISFGLLAVEHSTDTGSAANGGLYEDVTPGQMVETFNDWIFDPARKAGDTGLVKTEYGVHAMYFVSHGMPSWQIPCDSALRQADFDAAYTPMTESHPVEVYAEQIDQIPDLTGETAETEE